MRTATCKLHSLSPYSQSRMHQDEKGDKENHDDYEKRTWRSKAHKTEDGRIFMPPTALTLGLAEEALLPGVDNVDGQLCRVAIQFTEPLFFKPGEHIYYFTRAGLVRWMEAHGFKLLEHNDVEVECGREAIGSFAFVRALPAKA